MLVKATIKKDGTIITEVMDRQQHLCETVYQITDALGRRVKDEDISSACSGDPQFETIVETPSK